MPLFYGKRPRKPRWNVSIFKLLPKFFLVACRGRTPFSQIFHLSIDASGNDRVIAQQFKRSVFMIDNMRLAVKSLACIKSGFKFIDFHFFVSSLKYCLFVFRSVCFYYTQNAGKVNSSAIKILHKKVRLILCNMTKWIFLFIVYHSWTTAMPLRGRRSPVEPFLCSGVKSYGKEKYSVIHFSYSLIIHCFHGK